MAEKKVDLNTFLSDPALQGDRDLIFGAIDHRLKFHAEEAAKRRAAEKPASIFDVLFGGVKKEGE